MRLSVQQAPHYHTVSVNCYQLHVAGRHEALLHCGVPSLCIQGEDVRGTVGTLFDQIRDHFVKGKVSSAKNYILNAALVAQNKHAVTVMDKINTSEYVEWGVHVACYSDC